MSNDTHKLLLAFIEASGYEIKEHFKTELWKTIPFMGQKEYDMLRNPDFCGCTISRVCTDKENHWELHRKVVDYKVTKNESKAKDIISRLVHEIEAGFDGVSYELLEEARSYINETKD